MEQVRGFGISIFMHLAIITLIINLAPHLGSAPKILVIDFDILASDSGPGNEDGPLTSKVSTAIPREPPIPVEPPKPAKAVKQEVKPPKPVKRPPPAPSPLPAPPAIAHKPAAEPPKQPAIFQEQLPVTAAGIPSTGSGQENIFMPAKKAEQLISQYTKEHFLYVKHNIQQNINYPRLARTMGWQGKVVVEFTVSADGEITDLQIIKSSGFSALDQNALKTIKKAAPFPNPPAPARLVVPVVYRLG